MTTISSLASAAALSGTEPLPVDQSGATVKATVNQVKTYVNTSPAITGGSINSTPIGATTPSTGAFTSLIASGAITNSPVLGSSYIYSIRSSQTTGQVGINLGGGTGGTDWLLYQPAYSNVLTWYGAAANRMTLDTSGNLAVTGNISATGSAQIGAGNNGLVIQSYTGGGYGAVYSGGVVPSANNYSLVVNPFSTVLNVPIGGSVTITTGAGTSSSLLNVSATNISLTGGRVLIGTTTDDGVNALQVNGAGIFAGLIKPQQAATASAPAYVKGAIYFDTTLNKLRVGGATAWETITSV